MTYVSPIQQKVDLYLNLIDQGVPQAQALQQVGSTLAELSASGLDLTHPAELRATIEAADRQLDNYVRQVDAARARGLPDPPPPPGYSLPGQTVTANSGFTARSAATERAEPTELEVNPNNLPVAQSADSARFLRPGSNSTAPAVPTTTNDNSSFLTPGTTSTAAAVPVDPTFGTAGAGNLTAAELQSGVIVRNFTANANYQQVQFNNEERRRIIQEYQANGKSTAEAYQDPRYQSLVADGQRLRQQVDAGSTVESAAEFRQTPLAPGDSVAPADGRIATNTPVQTDIPAQSAPRSIKLAPVTDANIASESLVIPGEPSAAELKNQLSVAQTNINFDNFVASELKTEINDINRELANTTSPAKRQELEQQRNSLQQELTVTETRRDQLIQERDNLQTVVDQTGINVSPTPVSVADAEIAQLGERVDRPVEQTPFNGTFSATFDPVSNSWGVWNDQTGAFVVTGLTQSQAQRDANEFTGGDFRPNPPIVNPVLTQASAAQAGGEQQQATLTLARQQQSIREQRGQQNQGDWRVKLRLAPGATYLYKANDPGILWPLIETDGVIFPYTPRIDTSYRAVYDAIDLTHSNYRGYFYRNSYADFVQVQGTFTAQDTFEAEYLLAVITFFKSLTKMFYGQDPQRGSPPPLVYLTGLGEYQFSEHPCVVTQFNYNLPDNVDYIRARIANVNATNLLTRRNRSSVPSNPISSAIQRLASLGQGIKPGAMTSPPPPPTLGIDNPTYVPTKIDISLQLLPMQSRRQVSQQFSLKNFANGNLIKGGFW